MRTLHALYIMSSALERERLILRRVKIEIERERLILRRVKIEIERERLILRRVKIEIERKRLILRRVKIEIEREKPLLSLYLHTTKFGALLLLVRRWTKHNTKIVQIAKKERERAEEG